MSKVIRVEYESGTVVWSSVASFDGARKVIRRALERSARDRGPGRLISLRVTPLGQVTG